MAEAATPLILGKGNTHGKTLPSWGALSEKTSKMERLMRTDDYKFKNSKSANVWTILFTGMHMSEIKVVLAVS